MPKKKKNLVDSFMSGLINDAKSAVDSATKPDKKIPVKKDQDHIRIISVSEHDKDSINKVPDKEQVDIISGSPKEQGKISTKDQHRITSKKKNKSITKGSPSIGLSKSQTRVFLWFKQNGQTGEFNKAEIERSLSMPYITVRKAVEKLKNIGVLHLKYDRCQKLYEYSIKQENTLKLSKGISIISRSYQDRNNIGSPSPYNSSSSFLKNTTTNPPNPKKGTHPELDKFGTHPELGYWRQKGLKPKQVQNWMQEFQMSEDDIIEFLCYCRFDMVDNGKEEKDDINNVLSWFYRIVQKTGAYPKPKNYKSHQESQIEREKARLEELKRQADELRKIRQEATKAEFGLQFEHMLQNPEDPLYKECYEKLPAMMKKRGKKGSIAFENAMKAEFCRLNDIEDC
jgi:hypothetical protein